MPVFRDTEGFLPSDSVGSIYLSVTGYTEDTLIYSQKEKKNLISVTLRLTLPDHLMIFEEMLFGIQNKV